MGREISEAMGHIEGHQSRELIHGIIWALLLAGAILVVSLCAGTALYSIFFGG
jgi:hypothetical protein